MAEVWYVLSVQLAPVGYVIQDVVADAMTVEAVPQVDEEGRPIEPQKRRLMHTTKQTLGRVAIIGGGAFVAIINILVKLTPLKALAIQRRRNDSKNFYNRVFSGKYCAP